MHILHAQTHCMHILHAQTLCMHALHLYVFRMIHSGENELTCLQDVNVKFQDRSFVCHSLEQIMLGSRNDKWSIELDGKTVTNTGFQKQNKIRKVDWFNWDGMQIFQDETEHHR